MKTKFKRSVGMILAIVMLLSMLPIASAVSSSDFVDFPTGWSKVAMEAAVNHGLLVGYENNEIRPQANLTRGQMAAIITRSFGAQTKSDISAFQDVSDKSWYYGYIASAVKMGALKGVSANEMAPEAFITREEVFTAISRILVLSSDDLSSLDKFPDKAQISSWAASGMAALTKRGYINGDQHGNANPKAYITREEFAQFMHNAIRTYIAQPGTYTEDLTGITVVRVGGVTLKGFADTSDIVIGDGVGEGEVKITDVTIAERLLARGGTITLKNTTVGDRVVVNNVNGITYFKNYRDEKVFKGLVENTVAKFLTRGGSGGGRGSSSDDVVYTLTFKVDGENYDTVVVRNGVVDHTPINPSKEGYSFDGWYDEENNKVIDLGSVTSDMVLNAKFNINTYTLQFVAEEGKSFSWADSYVPPASFTVENYVNLPEDLNIVPPAGFTFEYWMYKGVRINSLKDIAENFDLPASSATIEITAHFEEDRPNVEYTLKLYLDDAKTELYDTVTVTNGVPDKTPADPSKVGYTFGGWFSGSTQITDFSSVTSSMDLVAKFDIKTYYVQYEATFENGYEYVGNTKYEYTIENIIPLASGQKVTNVPEGKYFAYWKDANGNKVSALTVTNDTPETIVLYPHFENIPPNPVIVTFYEGYNEEFDISTAQVNEGETVPENLIPDLTVYAKKGYSENESIASVYKNNEFTHEIIPSFWYVLKNEETGEEKLVPFDDTVVITENTSVYMLSRTLSAYLTFVSNNQMVSATAYYNDGTRVMDSLKDMAVSGRKQLNLALQTDMIPKYDETVDKLVEKLVSLGIIKFDANDNKNIQVLYIPVALSRLIKEDVANNMIKQYLRNVIADANELESIFNLIDVKDFADELDIDDIIDSMSDSEIAEIITSNENKEQLISFVLDDIKKDNSKMIDYIIEYITSDANFRNDIIDQLIAELKDATKTSTLKTEALKFIRAELGKTSSSMRAKFIDMVSADLKSQNSVVMPAVIKYVKTTLGADTADGKDLRKAVLTSNKLLDFLKDTKLKEEVIKLALTDSFINKALEDKNYRVILVEAIMENKEFLDTLLLSDVFHDYIIDQLHGTHELAVDVKALIADENSEFRKHVLFLVKHDAAFLKLLKDHQELYDLVLGRIAWNEFVTNDDDLLRYVLNQGNVQGTYSFVNLNNIEQIIATMYNEHVGVSGHYESLSNEQKQDAKTYLYNNKKTEILAKVAVEFETYKKSMLDTFVAGNADSITDSTVHSIIDKMLVDYVTKYINKETLDSNAAINTAITGAIEDILFKFVADLIVGVDLNDDALEAELNEMLNHIETVKHAFVEDDTVVAKLKTVVIDYKNGHEAVLEGIIEDNYDKISKEIVSLIDPANANSVYTEVEKILITVADDISDTLISDYVKAIDDTELKNLIGKYIVNVTTDDINKYIAEFLKVSANEATVRAELNVFVQADEQKETVKSFAISYIKDEANEAEIKNAISSFVDKDVDADFVNANREVIKEALKGINVTEIVDEEEIKNYIKGLNADEKKAFADKIFNALQNNKNYKAFMHSLMNEETFVINKDNLSMIKAIASAIENISFGELVGKIDNATINKIIEVIGEDYFEKFFDDTKNNYCNSLNAVIKEVSDSTDSAITRKHTTSLTFRVDLINDVYKKLYDKAQPIVVDKLNAANVYYNENEYLEFLVNHDILASLVSGDSSYANGDFTGYSLKGTMDYIDYALMLLIVGDDALYWYGDNNKNITEKEFEALYDAMFAKVFYAHEKLNDILVAFETDGTLPSQVQKLVDQVKQINDLIVKYGDKLKAVISKYLGSSINLKFEDGSIADDERVIKLVDLLVGRDDPIVNVDTLYALFYSYDENVQAKLKTLIDSGKLKKAVEKFESTSFGKLFSGKGKLGTVGEKLDEIKNTGKVQSAIDSVYDLLVIVAEKGIEPFRVDEGDITVKDAYEVKVGQIILKIKRYYQ